MTTNSVSRRPWLLASLGVIVFAFVCVSPWDHIYQISLDVRGFGAQQLGLETNGDAIKDCGTMLFSRGNANSVASYPICTTVFQRRDKAKPCNVLSFGIFDDPSFDVLFGRKGCRVDSYDPTIGKPTGSSPWAPFGSMFYNNSIGPANGINANFGWKEVSIAEAVQRIAGNPPTEPIHILKMDIEGSEWAALSSALSAGVFDPPYDIQQIIMEVHIGATGGDMSDPGVLGTSAARTWNPRTDQMISKHSDVSAHIAILRQLFDKGYRVIFRRPVGSVWNRERYIALPESDFKVRGQYDIALVKTRTGMFKRLSR